jgi:hypothetical protein
VPDGSYGLGGGSSLSSVMVVKVQCVD